MGAGNAGYSEIEHTADWELEVWGPDLAALLEQAARGMYALSGTSLRESPRTERSLALHAEDPEGLLVAFLSELLFFSEGEGVAFDEYQLQVDGNRLQAILRGAPLAGIHKEIKAVTYHNLKVQPGPHGLHVRIVFDV